MKRNPQELIDCLLTNNDFIRIPDVANRFNIFDAVGMSSQEIRHSTFLAFLLDPSESHGLHDSFLRSLIQFLVSEGVEAIDPDSMFLRDARIDREWNFIDIRIQLPKERVVVIIENKVRANEHSDQLIRYYEVAQKHHNGWQVIPVYLTPGGSTPSDPRYKAVRYNTVVGLIENILTAPHFAKMNPDTRILLRHYVELIRKDIVGGSELEELCRKIYLEHREAIDLINKYRPDTQGEMRTLIEELVTETEEVRVLKPARTRSVSSYQKFCVFLPTAWLDLIPETGFNPDGWTKRVCNFVIVNMPDEMYILLQLRPGPEEDRKRLYQAAVSAEMVPANHRMASYPELRRWNLLTPADYRTMTPPVLHEIVRSGWSDFVSDSLPQATDAFESGLNR